MTAGDVSVLVTNNHFKPALVCDGTDDYGAVNASTVGLVALAPTTGAIMGWIKPLSKTGTYCMFSAGDNNVVEHLHFGIESGKLHGECKVATVMQWDIDSTDAMDFSDNKWHHIACVMNGTRPVFYFDGFAVAMTDTTTTDLTAWYDSITGGDHGAIGILDMNATTTLDFDGGISKVKIFQGITLSASEIYNEFANGNANYESADARKVLIDGALYNSWVCDDLTDDGVGADNMTLTGNAINDLFYSDMVQKVNNAYTHAADIYTMVSNGDGGYTVMIVHGA